MTPYIGFILPPSIAKLVAHSVSARGIRSIGEVCKRGSKKLQDALHGSNERPTRSELLQKGSEHFLRRSLWDSQRNQIDMLRAFPERL